MLIVTGTFELEAAHLDRLREAAIVMAQATRDEPGCIAYAFWADIETPTTFRVYEEWTDRGALEAHFATPHMAVFRAALAEGGLVSRDVKTIEGGTVAPLG